MHAYIIHAYIMYHEVDNEVLVIYIHAYIMYHEVDNDWKINVHMYH
jgi:hypothetical protein